MGDWPVGWDVDFCLAFEQMVIVAELTVDIERALAEDANADAGALAGELAGTAVHAAELLDGLAEWEAAADLRANAAAMLALAESAGTRYARYVERDRENALNNARADRDAMVPLIEAVNDELGELDDDGLACAGHALILEVP